MNIIVRKADKFKSIVNTVIAACALQLSVNSYSADPPPPVLPEDIPMPRPSDERPIERLPELEKKPKPSLQLPKPDAFSKEGIANQLSIKVTGIKFVGNKVFSSTTLNEQISDYLGRPLSSLDLEEMRVKLTQFYIQHGYINSGATIPDQDLKGGVLIFAITEGRLTQVRLDHTGKLNPYYIERRIISDNETVLNIQDLQRKLYLLQKDPRIERINAVLGPGAARGESILNLQATEAQPYRLDLEINNHRPPSIGEWYGSLSFTHLNLSGWGDKTNIRHSNTKGLQTSSFLYGIPLLASETFLNIQAQQDQVDIIDHDFTGIELESESYSTGFGLEHPLYKAADEEFVLDIRLDKRRSETFWNGVSTAFSGTDTDDGINRITALRISQSWLKQDTQQVFAFRHTLNLGLNLLNPTLADEGPDGRFTSWLMQYQWARRYAYQLQSVFRTDLQLTQDELLSMEKFSVGGARSVRGYRENQFVRDNGAAISLEGRLPVFTSESGAQQLQLMAFYDYGRAWDNPAQGSTEEHETIKSLGLGIRWNYGERVSATLYWADPRDEVNNDDEKDDLQEKGYHFSFYARLL